MRTSILLIFSALIIISCSPSEGEAQTNKPNTKAESSAPAQSITKPVLLNPADFEQKVKATPEAQLIDVRTPGEVAAGKLPACTNINYSSDNFKDQLASLDKSKPVFVYCAVGGRSGRAANMLSQMGFSEVYDLDGGIKAWQLAGKNIVK